MSNGQKILELIEETETYDLSDNKREDNLEEICQRFWMLRHFPGIKLRDIEICDRPSELQLDLSLKTGDQVRQVSYDSYWIVGKRDVLFQERLPDWNLKLDVWESFASASFFRFITREKIATYHSACCVKDEKMAELHALVQIYMAEGKDN